MGGENAGYKNYYNAAQQNRSGNFNVVNLRKEKHNQPDKTPAAQLQNPVQFVPVLHKFKTNQSALRPPPQNY